MFPVRAALLTLCSLMLAACSVEKKELTRLASPDHATTVVVMQEVGGGAAISSTYYVYLSDGKSELSEPNLRATYCGGLSVAWEGSGRLLVEYDSECHIRQFANKWWSKSATQKAQTATVEIVLVRRQDKGLPQQP
jgi:hypothetical protein